MLKQTLLMMDERYVRVTVLFVSAFLSTILDLNENENRAHKNILYTLKAVPSGKFIPAI